MGSTLPAFTGGSVVLDAKHSQYLSINSTFATTLNALSSYSVTVSLKYNEIRTWARIFEFGVYGK